MLADMVLRREEAGLRVLALLAWLAATIWAVYYWLIPSWKFSPTAMQVAQWIERCRPEWQGRLSTVVELAQLAPNDRTASDSELRYGSIGFRQTALAQLGHQVRTLEWRDFLETTPSKRAAGILAGVLLLFTAVCLLWPGPTRLAMERLVMPWAVRQWPRADQLQLRDPPGVVALGSELQIEIIDRRPPLPESIELWVRAAGNVDGQSASLEIDRQSGQALMSRIPAVIVDQMAVANLPAMERAIEVRAVGGDDDTMPWHAIDVIRPPEIDTYHFDVEPPAYTRRPPLELVGRSIQVIEGSSVVFTGTFDESVRAVQVRELKSAGTPTQPPTVLPVAQLDSDRCTFTLADAQGQPLVVTESLEWNLTVTTEAGLRIDPPGKWSVQAVKDAPPTVKLVAPQMSAASAVAVLSLAATAVDDLGLVEVASVVRVDQESSEKDPSDRRAVIWRFSEGESLVREKSIQTRIDFSQLGALVAGQQIAIWLEAEDSLGQKGSSQQLRLEIQTSENLLAGFQVSQHQLLEQLTQLVEAQRRNYQLSSRTTELLNLTEHIEQQHLDSLQSIAQIQRGIKKQVLGDDASLSGQVTNLRILLQLNRLEETPLALELGVLEEELSQLATGVLESAQISADEGLLAARNLSADNARFSAKDLAEEVKAKLEQSSEAQLEALRSLQALLDRLSRHESLQLVQQELSQILKQQQRLRRETDQLQLEHLSRASDDALLARETTLAADQQGLARRLEDLMERARELSSTSSADQNILRSQIESASETLVSGQASSKMRRATDEIREQQLAQASSTQRQVSELLEAAMRELGQGSTPHSDLVSHLDDLRSVGEQLDSMANEQSRIASQYADPRSNPIQVNQQQDQLRQQAAQQADRAAQAGNNQTSEAMRSAVQSQSNALQAATEGNRELAAEDAQQAADQLRRAADDLETRLAALEQEAARQQMFQLSAAVNQLIEMQSLATERLVLVAQAAQAELQENNQAWQADARSAAAEQESVRQALQDVRGETTRLPTFDWTLEQAESAMSRSVAAAQRYRLEPDALEAAGDALRLLELAAEAMQQNPNTESSEDEGVKSKNASDTEGENESKHLVPALASLKLLRGLQYEINQRTLRATNEPNQVRKTQRLAELAEQQQLLGRQLEQLLKELESSQEQSQTGFGDTL
jgi:hypothetical protein